MDRFALTNARCALPGGMQENLAIVVAGDRIETICPMADFSSGTSFESVPGIDVDGRLTTAGLIDIHVHGADALSFDTVDPTEPARIADFYAARGVTAIAASLVSAAIPELSGRIENLRAAVEHPQPGHARVLGAHLEGPFLAVSQAGAHDPKALVSPDSVDWRPLVDAGDLLAMVTLAPELTGAVELTRALAGAGVVVAAGHSEARGRELRACVEAGLSHITHLWSGQSTLIRNGPWRLPGLLEESLASIGLTAEVIADGKHLPFPLLEIARRCLGGRLAIVSDATAGAGLPRGAEYDLGGIRCVVDDGVAVVKDAASGAFGGSVTPLPAMLDILVHQAGWDEHEAIMAGTAVPAGIMNAGNRQGRLAPGYAADIAIFDHGFRAVGTVVRGVVRGCDGLHSDGSIPRMRDRG